MKVKYTGENDPLGLLTDKEKECEGKERRIRIAEIFSKNVEREKRLKKFAKKG